MKWTTDKPTAPGHYWFRCKTFTGRELVNVYQVNDYINEAITIPVSGLWAYSGDGGLVSGFVADLDGEWAGPLLEPHE